MLGPVFEQASDIIKEEYPVSLRNTTSFQCCCCHQTVLMQSSLNAGIREFQGILGGIVHLDSSLENDNSYHNYPHQELSLFKKMIR